MQNVILFALLSPCILVGVQAQYCSFSPAVCLGSGSSYTLTGEGRITAVRVWEANSNHIYGFQFRYGYIWSRIACFSNGYPKEFKLWEDEAIIQVTGTYSQYVQSVVFTTNRSRTLTAGHPLGESFNMYPTNSMAELRLLSGCYHGGITSIGAHWAVV